MSRYLLPKIYSINILPLSDVFMVLVQSYRMVLTMYSKNEGVIESYPSRHATLERRYNDVVLTF